MKFMKLGRVCPKVERLLWSKTKRRATYGIGTTDGKRFVVSSSRSDEAYARVCYEAMEAGVDLVYHRLPLPLQRKGVPHFLRHLARQLFPLPSSWVTPEPANDVDLSHRVVSIELARERRRFHAVVLGGITLPPEGKSR